MPQLSENKKEVTILIEFFRAFFRANVHFRTHQSERTSSHLLALSEAEGPGLLRVDGGDAGGGFDGELGGRPGFEELLFAIDHGVDVVGSEFEAVSVSNGVGGAGFDAIAAEDAAGIVDVVDLGVTVGVGDAILGGVFGGFDVNAIGGAGGGAEEAGDALLEAVFVALQDVNAAVARLEMHGLVRIVLRGGLLEHGDERHFEAFIENFEGAEEFCDHGCHEGNLQETAWRDKRQGSREARIIGAQGGAKRMKAQMLRRSLFAGSGDPPSPGLRRGKQVCAQSGAKWKHA
jgi:hypothetical protein